MFLSDEILVFVVEVVGELGGYVIEGELFGYVNCLWCV